MDTSVLTNRELSSFILLMVLIVFVATRPNRGDLVQSVRDTIEMLKEPSITIPLLLYVGWICASVAGAARLGLWDVELLGTTILWLLLSGFGLVMSLGEAIKHRGFFRRAAVNSLGVVVIVEFVASLESFSLWIEIPGQGLAVLCAMMAVVPGTDPPQQVVRKLANGYLVLYGVSALIWGLRHLVLNWSTLDHGAIARDFLLPMWLTPLALLYVYGFALVAAYQTAFQRMRYWNEQGSLLRQRLAMLLRANGRLGSLRLLSRKGEYRVARASSFFQAWREVGALEKEAKEEEAEAEATSEGIEFEDAVVPGIFAPFTTGLRLAVELNAILDSAARDLSRTREELEAVHDRLRRSHEAFQWLGPIETAKLIQLLAHRGRDLEEIEMMALPIAMLLAVFQPEPLDELVARFDRLLIVAGEPAASAMDVADILTADAKSAGATFKEVVDARISLHGP